MEIEYYGANCFRIKTKKTSIVIDDNLSALGQKSITKDTDVAVFTNKEMAKAVKLKARLTLESAGEFEIGDVSVKAVQTRAHMDEEGADTATVFQFLYNGTTITALGHIHPDVANDVLELSGGSDVVLVPVGGNGYTLDSVGALSIIKKIEPEVVIPSHYDAPGFKFEVPAAPLEDFIKTSALVASEPKDLYKVDKPDTELAGQTHLVILTIK
jgi:L-ascorbate metabolism protein UlaG (beta-lactamase superfamily)